VVCLSVLDGHCGQARCRVVGSSLGVWVRNVIAFYVDTRKEKKRKVDSLVGLIWYLGWVFVCCFFLINIKEKVKMTENRWRELEVYAKRIRNASPERRNFFECLFLEVFEAFEKHKQLGLIESEKNSIVLDVSTHK